ncbi:condensin complex subunit 3-like [Symsagittifera roscoffensis]|uniref:condensin complex subunit 3-like n=1 Tax=Symsagittifera roscoffensis TaxID=84072 RepID=UPI00307CC17C
MPPRKGTKKALAAGGNGNGKEAITTLKQNEKKLQHELINLFDKVQNGKLDNETAVSILRRYYEKARGVTGQNEIENIPDFAENIQDFNTFISGILVQNYEIPEKSFPVEKSLKLFASFACYCIGEELPFVDQLTWLIEQFHDDQRKQFRLKTCQLILNIMTLCASEEIDLSVGLWNKLRNILLVRSRDKSSEARLMAVKALVFFQPQLDDEDMEDDAATRTQVLDKDAVVKQLAFLLGAESAEIRKVVLSSLVVNNNTVLKCILRHCRDVDMGCRAIAVQTLSQFVTIKALSFQQRVDVLTIAFRNSSHPAMEAAVKSLLNSWLSQVGGGISDFLKVIDPVLNPLLCSKLVHTICISLPNPQMALDSFDVLDERKLLSEEWCSPENAFQWIKLLEFLKDQHQTELLDKNTPNVSEFAHFLAHHSKKLGETDVEDELISRTFVLQQFLDIAELLDLSMDEVGRKNLAQVLECNLRNASNNEYSRLVTQELKLLYKLLGKQKFIHASLDAIDELRFPLGGTSSDDFEVQKGRAMNKSATEMGNQSVAGSANESSVSSLDASGQIVDLETSMLREQQFQLNKLRVEIIKCRDVMDSFVAERDFMRAQEEKETLTQLERQKDEIQKSIDELKNVKVTRGLKDKNKKQKEGENNKEDEVGEKCGEGDASDSHENDGMRSGQNRESTEETKDPIAIFQWLSIAHRIPQQVRFNSLPLALQQLRTTLVQRLATPVDAVRLKTVQCIGVYSVFDKEYAVQMLPLIVQVVLMDRKEKVQLVAFRVLFDILLRHGLSAVTASTNDQNSDGDTTSGGVLEMTSLNETFLNHNHNRIVTSPDLNSSTGSNHASDQDGESGGDRMLADDESSPNSKRLINILVKYLDSVNSEMRCAAVEGLSKLMLHDRIASPEIFCRLCILWFSPTSKQEGYLKQCLGQFFPLFAIGSKAHQDCIRKSFLPVVRTIYKAPLTSPLASIDCELLTKYLVTIMSPCNERLILQNPEGVDILRQAAAHEQLGKQLCEEILTRPEERYVPCLAKALSQLEITPESTIFTQQEFSEYLNQIELILENGQIKRNVIRLKSRVSASLNNESIRSSALGTERDSNISISTNGDVQSNSSMNSLFPGSQPLQPISQMPNFDAISEAGESDIIDENENESLPNSEAASEQSEEKPTRTRKPRSGKRTRVN